MEVLKLISISVVFGNNFAAKMSLKVIRYIQNTHLLVPCQTDVLCFLVVRHNILGSAKFNKIHQINTTILEDLQNLYIQFQNDWQCTPVFLRNKKGSKPYTQ